MDAVKADRLPDIQADRFSASYTRWAVILLMLAYTSNVIDRNILAMVSQSIKLEFRVSDASLGLLQGLAFAAFYAIMGLPIARFAERHNRVNILTVCLAVWSVMTVLTGTVVNFLQLVLCRFGVGIGEAGCAPSAHSLITDYYPPERRASALAVYTFAVPFGSMIGAIVVGWAAQRWGWRVSFFFVGLPGLLLAILMRFVLREPVRGQSDARKADEAVPSIWSVTQRMFRNRSLCHLTWGLMLKHIVGYGATAFAPLYLIREFGLSLTQVGLIVGLTTGISTGLGTLLSGYLVDWAAERDQRWYAKLPALGSYISTPLYLIAYSTSSLTVTIVFLLLAGVFGSSSLAPTFAVMHNLVEPRMRATAAAILLFCLNLLALSFGPWFTGKVSDIVTARLFSVYGIGSFSDHCLVATSSLPHDLAQKCLAASSHGTRWAILATFCFGFWGATHYLLAARHIRQDFARAG
jgi:MFS family permease